MTSEHGLQFRNFTGAQALDAAQYVQTSNGVGVLFDPESGEGCQPFLNPDAQGIRINVEGGEIVLLDNIITVSPHGITLPNGDIDWPRRDVIYLDIDGQLNRVIGTPRVPHPEGSVGRQAERPEIPDMRGIEGVPIAVVWVPAGANSPSDIDASTMIQDRRVRPWPRSMLTEFDDPAMDAAVTSNDEIITGAWTFDAPTTFSGGIPGLWTGSELVPDVDFEFGPIATGVFSESLTVQLDAVGTDDNEYISPQFVPAGKTARLYAWGKARMDGSHDADLRLRWRDPSGNTLSPPGSFTGSRFEENPNGLATYENTSGSTEAIWVELSNRGSNVFQPGGTVPGVFVSFTVVID